MSAIPHPHTTTRSLTIALIAALVAAVVVLSIALATEDDPAPAAPVQVAPSSAPPAQNFNETIQPGGSRAPRP